MATAAPLYDLMLLLSTNSTDERRAKVLDDVRSAISSDGGEVQRNDEWGTRGLTYQISHQADAEYHLLQFSGSPTLLDSLSHSLRIADDVLRFRIIKSKPGTPAPPDSPPPVVAGVAATSGGGPGASATTASAGEPDSTATVGSPKESPDAAAQSAGAGSPAGGDGAGGAPAGGAETSSESSDARAGEDAASAGPDESRDADSPATGGDAGEA